MFDRLHTFAVTNGLTMTCYVDDMAFSGNAATGKFLFDAKRIVKAYGLRGHKAISFADGAAKVVTGLCLTPDGAIVPNKLHLKIKTGFDALAVGGPNPKIERALLGRLEAAGKIDPRFKARAATLRIGLKKPPKGSRSADTL